MPFDIDVDIKVVAVVRAAYFYRKLEHDDTPRLWRGKQLQDLATILDKALEEYISIYGMGTFEDPDK